MYHSDEEKAILAVGELQTPPSGALDSIHYYGMMAELEASRDMLRDAASEASTDAPLAFASWIHGTCLHVEHPANLEWVYRAGMWARVLGKGGTGNWLHFNIPTPVITGGVRRKLDSVMLYFQTGSVASILRHVHVYDGPHRIATHENVNFTGAAQWRRFMVPNQPPIYWGINITVGVEFLAGSYSRDMWFFAAGADFY
jgi:hypothetical protein